MFKNLDKLALWSHNFALWPTQVCDDVGILMNQSSKPNTKTTVAIMLNVLTLARNHIHHFNTPDPRQKEVVKTIVIVSVLDKKKLIKQDCEQSRPEVNSMHEYFFSQTMFIGLGLSFDFDTNQLIFFFSASNI